MLSSFFLPRSFQPPSETGHLQERGPWTKLGRKTFLRRKFGAGVGVSRGHWGGRGQLEHCLALRTWKDNLELLPVREYATIGNFFWFFLMIIDGIVLAFVLELQLFEIFCIEIAAAKENLFSHALAAIHKTLVCVNSCLPLRATAFSSFKKKRSY